MDRTPIQHILDVFEYTISLMDTMDNQDGGILEQKLGISPQQLRRHMHSALSALHGSLVDFVEYRKLLKLDTWKVGPNQYVKGKHVDAATSIFASIHRLRGALSSSRPVQPIPAVVAPQLRCAKKNSLPPLDTRHFSSSPINQEGGNSDANQPQSPLDRKKRHSFSPTHRKKLDPLPINQEGGNSDANQPQSPLDEKRRCSFFPTHQRTLDPLPIHQESGNSDANQPQSPLDEKGRP